jgi:hypothetical protein
MKNGVDTYKFQRNCGLNIIKQNGSLNCMVINMQFLVASPCPRIETFGVALSFCH